MNLNRGVYMPTLVELNITLSFLVIILTTCLPHNVLLSQNMPDFRKSDENTAKKLNSIYKFTKNSYNVTIPENSIGKTYAMPKSYDYKMGLIICSACSVSFKIISGDRDKLFKAEERIVGNFALLAIRTKTNNVVLNREKNDEYVFRIRAFIVQTDSKMNFTHEADCIVNLHVLDRNDLSPLFYPSEYSTSIYEDLPAHSSILKVSAEDADLGLNGDIYYSFQNDNPYFAIHPSSGIITSVTPLINLGGKQMIIVVLAADRGSSMNLQNHQPNKATVMINIKKSNLYAPEFLVSTIPNIILNDETDISKNIFGVIRVTDKDIGKHGAISDVRIISGDEDGIFFITKSVEKTDYYLKLSELAVLSNTTNIYNLTIRAEDNGIPKKYSIKIIPVTITVNNLSGPVFTKQLYEVSIPETSPPNMPVIRLKVTDQAFGKNALVFLEIVGGNEGGEFKINPETGMLYTQKTLDAEKTSIYTLTVSAIDQANLGVRKQSSAKVIINILDINDNDPIFDVKNITVDLRENEIAGTYVTKVSAKDKDSGENAYITYSIANIIDVPFDIDHFSGVIRTTALLDYELMRRSYKLKVRASDWGLPYRRQAEMEVNINISDLNDNRPQFERVNCEGKILRRAPVGTEIFTVSAIDIDFGDYVTYRIISGNEDGCFNLDPTTGIITIGCDLDDLAVTHRTINVSATDGTHFSDDMAIQIHVLSSENYDLNAFSSFECHETGVAKKLADILAASEKNNLQQENEFETESFLFTSIRYGMNIHNPEFINFSLDLNVSESLPLGDTITWLKAKDGDLGYNGKLVYGIAEGDNESVFRVDPDSGELQLIGFLDRERTEEYLLNITVCDMGKPMKCDSEVLTINVLDVNDNPPVFQKTVSRFHLKEDSVNGSLILCLNASDADSGNNAAIFYEIQNDNNLFEINPNTGCLFLRSKLDREKQNEHKLRIYAKDCGVPSLTGEASVTIVVDDVNDNPPVFGAQEIIFKVTEDVPLGTVVAKIEANDLDSGINGVILFSIKEDYSNGSFFKIDKHSGIIRTIKYLDYETKQVFNLVIGAVDCGQPSLSSYMPVVIEIIDVNENRFAPEFNDFIFTKKVKENIPIGTIVTNITARDLDTNVPDSEVSYFVCGGDGLGVFSVNNKGFIRTLSHLDAETKNYYWLTLCAQDHAIVPLSSCTQVYIEVENVNDNVPMTDKPVYYTHVTEGSRPMTHILKLNATDDDIDTKTFITYKIISGNPEGYFEINKVTGELMTTERKLDRENQSEHILEIYISDNGSPSLHSTTRIVVVVDDINDNSPQFDQRFYKAQIPSLAPVNTSVFQILATDNDVGDNGRISYFIKSGKGKNKFRIDEDTGLIFAVKILEADHEYELIIKGEDNGVPKRSQTTRLNILVVPILNSPSNPPQLKKLHNLVEVTESDKPGFLVTLIQATDDDSEYLWFNISDGNENNEFYIGHDNGNILLSKPLDRESKAFYNLSISVSDGLNIVNTNLYVKVVDTNDNRPQFSKNVYYVNISESTKEETVILQLHATDLDEDQKIFYTLHGSKDPSSLEFFRIDSVTGNVVVTQSIDYEKNRRHELTVIAKDQGTPAKRNYAKIIVYIEDHNDHYPVFTNKILQRKIPESSAVGTKVVQLHAIDRDSGKNGEVKYSIVSGNVGNVFEIDGLLGNVILSQPLNIVEMQEYMLQIKASDCGNPPLSSQIPVHIVVVMADNDPPRFYSQAVAIEIYENLPIGSFIRQFDSRSSSSVFYNIIDGNDDEYFYINPSTGVLLVNSKIDFEIHKVFNLTIKATNMASVSSYQNAVIHILDVNDNPPHFVQTEYNGNISEASLPGSYVSSYNIQDGLLLIKALDEDAGINSILEYTILDDVGSQYFRIDSLTGTLQLLQSLDYESKTFFKFSVMVNDKGSPKLYSNTLATVLINVMDVNDCPPDFVHKELNVTLYLPTFKGIFVTEVTALDMDKSVNNTIRYDIVDGNSNNSFEIDSITGILTTRNIYDLKPRHTLHIRASDGLFSSISIVDIYTMTVSNSVFQFQKKSYEFTTVENSTKVSVLGIVNVIGNSLVENVEYQILNPTNLFEVGQTSGAIKTKGLVFDRESVDKYNLIVEARSCVFENGEMYVRRSVTQVSVVILDINDNCPMFVNLPYYATVSLEDLIGSVLIQIKAIDLDSHENGEVRYEMKKGNGELFKVDRKTGEIFLKQKQESTEKKYELLVAAYDNAMTPCYTEVPVEIKIVDKSMPIFNKQFYYDTVREDVELFSALSVNIHAESPLERNIIYTISSSNDEFFEIDYRTGVMYVIDDLDYETKHSHEVIVRATDMISGAYAEVTVSICVEDANDCYPHIYNNNINVTLPENTVIGTLISKINATDCDSDANSILSYVIESTNGNPDSDLLYINIADGSLHLKRQLDFEDCKSYLVVVSVNDHGTPSLTSKANIWINVEDINDNTPKFIEPSFTSKLSLSAPRGQFILRTTAYDADESDKDKLKYKIVDGNENQIFSIQKHSGVIVLQNNQRLQDHKQTVLNISVTDGTHTSYARVKINMFAENNNYPSFEKAVYEVFVMENSMQEENIVTVKAVDKDFGMYGSITYEITSDDMSSFFGINKINGSIYTKIVLDREQRDFYDFMVKATDGGGKYCFSTIKIKVVDSNDNTPKFLFKKYNWVVKDDAAINSVVGKLTAFDLDEGNNGLVNYTFENNDDDIKQFLSLTTNGELIIIKSLANTSKKLIQFFVRATDNGFPHKLSSFVPISLQIISENITVPTFERKRINITVDENIIPGSILAKPKVIGNYSVKFSLASHTTKFSISDNGEVILMENLDREKNALEHVSIMLETTTQPVLYSYTEIFFYIQDQNDNYPTFLNFVYSINVPENSEKGTSIIKVTAVDPDEGLNGDVRYYMENDNLKNVFEIDVYSGWIIQLNELDRETQSEFYFYVWASDNGKSKHKSKVPVSIIVTDYNDNPPVFKQEHQIVYVAENALPGTVVALLLVTDLDSESNILDYYIVSGDNFSQFHIAKSGELFVSKSLDREYIPFYNISIGVTDGKFVTFASVSIFITDINDNYPICVIPRYELVVVESEAVDTPIATVNTLDYDDNSLNKKRFYITGNNSNDFYVDKDDGVLKIAKKLDREKISSYILNIHVQDGTDLLQECVCEAFISIKDVNDNHPTFSMQHYIVSVAEDAQVDTIVTKVHAIDKDFGINRKILYSFEDENDFFEINNASGIVKLKKTLDREIISVFNLSIKAEDFGNPMLFSTTLLTVHILDINDNPPEFHFQFYKAYLSENSPLNTRVVRVYASSKDVGVNAEISYFIIAGNEQSRFKIDSTSGEISLNSQIDFEKTKVYFLTVQAIDGGTPPLSSQAFVNISILDINDNFPQFSQNLYRVKIKEDIQIGEQIIHIAATDADSGHNGIVSYNIETEDRLKQFSIDEFSGNIYVRNKLDREEISSYVLEIRACDKGEAPLCSYVQVFINVLDVNDNAPLFGSSNYSILLQENKPLGFVVLNFNVTDADEYPNADPYTFDFKQGNEGGVFRLEQDGSLRTAYRFNHKIRDIYILQIRVFDNGIPPLFSDTWITIKIIEESQYPPIVTPLEITINSYEDDYVGGFLGKIYVSDQDEYDTFTYNLEPSYDRLIPSQNLFNISQTSGDVYAIKNLDVGIYLVNVTVSDGKFISLATVRISVELITSEMVENAVIVKFADISPKDFILKYKKSFLRTFREILRCRQTDIIIISIKENISADSNKIITNTSSNVRNRKSGLHISQHQNTHNVLEIAFAVHKQQIIPNSESYFTSDEILHKLLQEIDAIEDSFNLSVEEIVSTECEINVCTHGRCRNHMKIHKNKLHTYYTDVVSYVVPEYNLISTCECYQGFAGKKCEEPVNACSSNPCPTQKQCWPADTDIGFQCICPTGFSGQFCEIQSSKCSNGKCTKTQTPISFRGKSYAQYKINKNVAKSLLENRFSISLKLRTVQQSGTLVYASGRVDYNIIEIINGTVQYKFDLGSGEGLVEVSSINISDGEWHSIKMERILNAAKLIVDNNHSSQGSTPGNNMVLNLQSNDLFIGAKVEPHRTIMGYEDIQRGFIGCMSEIQVGDEILPLHISGEGTIATLKRFTNVEFFCDPLKVLVSLGICGGQPCQNYGMCQDLGTHFKCICPERFTGKTCEIDLDPCMSAPCLYGGICQHHGPNNYSCLCPTQLSGKRCEYGHYCEPNPCQNGGICEEGDGIPHCMCRGFTGPTCEIDVDECENQPCGNGATCINESGSFRCICPSYLTGASCGDPLYSNSISTKLRNFSIQNITGIICGVALVFTIFIVTLCCIVCKKYSSKKSKNSSQVKNSYKETTLNSLLEKEKNNKTITKISNLEVNQRPLSYTPISNENLISANSRFVNNLDILRSYGSAGDELENIPFEYQKINFNKQNININNENISEVAASSYKSEWCDHAQLKTFCENKISHTKSMENRLTAIKPYSAKLIQVAMPVVCQSSLGSDYFINGQYHWDCSDWARSSHNPLPDITEVPGAEIADSSSFHSDESNGSGSKALESVKQKLDSGRDIGIMDNDVNNDPLDRDVQDDMPQPRLQLCSNSLSRLSPMYNIENEDYTNSVPFRCVTKCKMYKCHPDSYLPPLNNLSETDGEINAHDICMKFQTDPDDGIRALSVKSEEVYLCHGSAYSSNLSVHLCEIEDSELEEFLPKKE